MTFPALPGRPTAPGLFRILLAGLLCAALTACGNLPRGAALRSEVLQTGAQDDPALRDFVVAPVTRALLPVYAAWPALGSGHLPWIERTRQPANRIIAAGDTVALSIWSTEESGLLTSNGTRSVELPQLRVGSGGSVFLPYVGQIRIAGMSPERARERIEEAYLPVVPSVQVLLSVVEGRQNSVSLVSGVANPGTYPLPDTDFTVLGLIAEGGGVASTLNNPRIRLNREGRSFGISLDRLLDNPGLDTTLVGGDQIFVQEDDRVFLSLGAAGNEAVFPFPQDQLSALEALAAIGGVSDTRADPQGVLILRRYPAAAVRAPVVLAAAPLPDAGTGTPAPEAVAALAPAFSPEGPPQTRVVFTIDLTSADGLFSAGEFPIQPGDLVYATESPVTSVETIFGLIGNAFGLATRAANVAG